MPEHHSLAREAECERLINRNLLKVYQMHLVEPVPLQFRVLLDKLRQHEPVS